MQVNPEGWNREDQRSASELARMFMNRLSSGHFDRAVELLHPEGIVVLGIRVVEGGMDPDATVEIVRDAWSAMGGEVAIKEARSLGHSAALVDLTISYRPDLFRPSEQRLWLCTSLTGLLFRGLAVGSRQNPWQILRNHGMTLGLA